MSVVFTDAYTVTGGNVTLASYPSGSPDYANILGGANLQVVDANDNVQCTVTVTDVIYRITDGAVPTGDQKISANCGVRSGYDQGYIGVRGAASGNAYILVRASSSTWELYRYDGGSATLLTSYSVATTDNTTQAVALKATGAGATVTVTPTIAGSDRTAYADSSGSRKTSGTPTVAVYQDTSSTGNFVDDVSVDDLASSGASITATQGLTVFGQTATLTETAAATASQGLTKFGQTATLAAVEVVNATQALTPFGQTATLAAVEAINAAQALTPFGQVATLALGSSASVTATQDLPPFGLTATAAAVEALTGSQALTPFGQAATLAETAGATASQPLTPFGQAATLQGAFPALSVDAAQELPPFGQVATVHNATPANGGGGLLEYEIALAGARKRRHEAEQAERARLERQAAAEAAAAAQALQAEQHQQAAARTPTPQQRRDAEAATRRAMRRAITQAGVEALRAHLAVQESLQQAEQAAISAMQHELDAANALLAQQNDDEIAIWLLTAAVQ